MDCSSPAPVQKICLREATIFQPAPAQEVESAIRQSGVNKRRSCIYQMAILALAGAQLLFCPFTIFDINTRAVPLDDFSSFVAQWYLVMQVPAVLPVSAPHA